MLLHNKLQKDYTLNQSGYQLKLPLKLETIIPKNDSVRLLSQFVEEMDLTDLYSTYDRINSLSPRTLLKIVLYSYMNGDYSSRSMELNCKRDINFLFLLEGHSAPDHATLAGFRSIHFAPCSKRILAEVSNILFDLGEISGETIFIDGTKIEADANKYTFVWKKAVTKNQAKLLIKLADFVAECEQLYDIKIVYGNVVKIKHLKRLLKKLYALKNAEHNLKFKYKNITADAGYESEENYLFLEANNQIAFIKPANYEISKTRKYKNDIGKIENMEYDKISDFYTCKNNRKLTVSHIRHNKTKTGYVSEKTIYTCENCSDCPCKSDCIKGNGLRMYSLKVLF